MITKLIGCALIADGIGSYLVYSKRLRIDRLLKRINIRVKTRTDTIEHAPRFGRALIGVGILLIPLPI